MAKNSKRVIFDFSASHLAKNQIKKIAARLSLSANRLTQEAFFNLPNNKVHLQAVGSLIKEKTKQKFDLLVLLGIGASSLGTKAVHSGLEDKTEKKLLFLETVDFKEMSEALGLIRKSKPLFVVVSDSGKTIETITNFLSLKSKFNKNNSLIITQKDSPLWSYASKQQISTIEIPKNVHGRFSVFSANCLVPLGLAGIDINRFLAGARVVNNEITESANGHSRFFNLAQGRQLSSGGSLKVSDPVASTLFSWYHYQRRLKIHNLFMLDPHLENLGKWWSQLIAETLGKNGKGITPLVSVGSLDLHSLFQLYLGGPKDKFATFVEVEHKSVASSPLPANSLAPFLGRKTLGQIAHPIHLAVKTAFRKQGLPFSEVRLPKIDEYHLGYFMQSKLIETYLLAKLMKVEPFNQPGVELYKKETRRILKRKLISEKPL